MSQLWCGRAVAEVPLIYTAVNATAARAAFDDLAEKWCARYPAVIRLWDNAWAEFIGLAQMMWPSWTSRTLSLLYS